MKFSSRNYTMLWCALFLTALSVSGCYYADTAEAIKELDQAREELLLPEDSVILVEKRGEGGSEWRACNGVGINMIIGANTDIDTLFDMYTKTLVDTGWVFDHGYPSSHSYTYMRNDEMVKLNLSTIYYHTILVPHEQVEEWEEEFETLFTMQLSRPFGTALECAEAVGW